MGNFTFEEMNLMCIYNTGSRTGLIDSLREMRGELAPEETELRELTDSALGKLQAMSDAEFAELELYPDPGFLPENPLKNAEMTVEDDYGMIDGIINNGAKEPTVAELEQQARSGQPISLMDLADAVHREEREKKKSVVDQLKSQPKAEHKKTAPKKSAEREI